VSRQTDDALVVDEPSRWGLTLALASLASKNECVVDVTPRRCQKFAAKPGKKFQWTNKPAGVDTPVQSGEATADQYGLVTLPAVIVIKTKNRLRIEKK
jgi:hypothetical protein